MPEGLIKGTKVIFLKIINGKIARKTTEADPNAEKYTNRDGAETWYEFYKSAVGLITSITHKDPPEQHKEWSGNWNINLKAGDNNLCLQLSEGSGYANAFFCILPNIDPNYTVTITPQEKETVWNGVAKNSRTVFINQQGQALSWYYKKDDMKDMPEIKKIEMRGKKTVWDDFERNEFFKKLMADFNSQIQINKEAEPEELEDKVAREADEAEDLRARRTATGDDEDLPF